MIHYTVKKVGAVRHQKWCPHTCQERHHRVGAITPHNRFRNSSPNLWCQNKSPNCQERHRRPGAAIQAPRSGVGGAVPPTSPDHTHHPWCEISIIYSLICSEYIIEISTGMRTAHQSKTVRVISEHQRLLGITEQVIDL